MKERITNFVRSDTGALILFAAICCLIHVATNGKYGFHRDELQTLDDARHLDWGFVAYPPITPVIGRVELILFGTSLIGFRFFAAVAISISMVITGSMAQELGGSRQIQLLAAAAVAISPFAITQAAVMQYVSFDYLWGVAACYFLVRLLKSGDARWWLAIGTALGLGMETRYTMGFLALGIVGGVLVTSARRFFLSHWLWIGVAISILIFLPNVIWQVRHQFVSLDFLKHLHARDLRQGRYAGFYREQLLVCANIVTAPLVALGLWFCFFRSEGRRFRTLGWTLVITFMLFAVAGARSYYTAPLYPAVLAAGSVLLGIWLANFAPVWSGITYGLQWGLIVINGVVFALLAMPIAPLGSSVWNFTAKLHDQFREEIGWPELANAVASVYSSLPPNVRAQTGILAGNYGEAGALNLYGPALGLPHAMSLTNSLWYRGYDPRQPQSVIVTGFDPDELEGIFQSCILAAKYNNPFGVKNEESVYHQDIFLCKNLRTSWPEYWSRSRRYG
jgi:4-amino-4-deoxy-L-arabinose transferase-like glycosyltransferase